MSQEMEQLQEPDLSVLLWSQPGTIRVYTKSQSCLCLIVYENEIATKGRLPE